MKEALCQIATYSSRTGKSNLWFGGKNLNIFVPKEKGKVGNRINREGAWKIFLLDGQVPYLDRGFSYTDVCISQNSANVHLRFVLYTEYKFYVKRKNEELTFSDIMLNYLAESVQTSAIYFEMCQKIKWIDRWRGMDKWIDKW